MNNVKIVGISGKAGSGKDYISKQYISPMFGYRLFSLAWHLKVDVVNLKGQTYEDVFYNKPPEVRHLLQYEGTEIARHAHGEDIWINKMFTWFRILNESWGINKFVVPDVRFPNEVRAIQQNGGVVIRLSADSRVRGTSLSDSARSHSSESSLDTYPLEFYDAVLSNEVGEEHTLENRIISVFNTLNLI